MRLPNLEGQILIFPKKRVAHLYPQTLGCMFVEVEVKL
jgi:hypothetical protein